MSFWQTIPQYMQAKDHRPIMDYAAEKIKLFAPITRTGFFRTEESRHFELILSWLDDGRVREVNILKPVRGGGSLLGDIHLESVMSVDRDSGPYMNVFQTDADAKMHFFDRIHRIMEGNECSQSLFPPKYEWSEIRLNNGHTMYTGGPGISNLQSKGVRYLRLDECWIYPAGRMVEAEARVGDYLVEELSKILRISQGGPREGLELERCEWRRAYQRGEIHEWEVACPLCQKYYEPVFSGQRADGSFWGITWDKIMLPNGDWDIAKAAQTGRFECPHCAGPVLDTPRTKSEWNRTGRYRHVGEENKKRKSSHWECVINFPWDELIELWLDACNSERRGDLKPKVQFYQKRRAMFKDEESLLKGGLHLRRVTYTLQSDWPDEKGRFMSIDRQDEDLFWWMIRLWSQEKSRRLAFGKAYGFAALEEIRKKFKVEPNHTFCDSAFVPKGDHGVYSACAEYGWVAVRGDKEWYFPHRYPKTKRVVMKSYSPLAWGDPGMGTAQQNRKYCHLLRFSKPQMNQKVQELIDHGRWEEPILGEDPELEKEYNAQMSARIKRTEYDAKTGEAKIYWRESKNDHARDLANQQVLGAILADLLLDPASERLSPKESLALSEKTA